MFAQFLPSRKSLVLFGSTSFAALLVISAACADSCPLSAETLSKARGRDQGSSLYQADCNTAAGNPACTTPNTFCAVCDSTTYTALTAGGALYNGPTGSGTLCGFKWAGVCSGSLSCAKSTSQLGVCITPGPVTPQP